MTTTNTDVVIRGHNAFRKSVTQCRKMGAVDRLLARNRRLLVLLARSSNLFLIPIASAIPSYGRRRLFCFYYVPLSRCPSQYPMPTSTFFISLRTNNERMSTKLAEGTHYRRQMNSLHFRWNYTRNKGAGYGRKFESKSNRCFHDVANDFTNFTVSLHTTRLYTHAAAQASYDRE